MAISVNWPIKVINVPKADMTLVQSNPFEIRQLDLNVFRLALKDLEDNADGMPFPKTHNHNTEITVAGITLSRVIEIVNGYTVTFEDGQYAVNLVGANSNVSDVVNLNQVSIRSANSAGLITVSSGSGLSTEEHDQLMGLPDLGDVEGSTVLAKEMSVTALPTLVEIEASTILAKQAELLRALGMMQENYYLDQTVYSTYNGVKLLTNGRVRTYSNPASVGTANDVLATYLITASWSNDELTSYQVVRQ